MKAARLHAFRTPLRLDDVPRPDPAAGEVVVRVAGAGLCHSDLHICDGELPLRLPLPLTLGHENAGYVAAVGAGVTAVREGDAVLVYGGWGCGRCDGCVGGTEQLCVDAHWGGASEHAGGYAEYLRVPAERHLVPLRRLSPRDAAPLADAALTSYRAVVRARPWLLPDYPALLVGLGGLGENGLQLLRLLSGCPVVVVDSSASKRQRAQQLGAAHAVDGHAPDLVDQLRAFAPQGYGAAFDFVGSDATLAACIGTTRAGGKVTQLGLAGGSAALKVLFNSRFEVSFEATLWGSIRELREVTALAESGRLPLLPVEHVPLERINEAMQRLRSGAVEGRLVITP